MTARIKAAMPTGDEAALDGLDHPSREWLLGDVVYAVARYAVSAVEEKMDGERVCKLAVEHIEVANEAAASEMLAATYETRVDSPLMAELAEMTANEGEPEEDLVEDEGDRAIAARQADRDDLIDDE